MKRKTAKLYIPAFYFIIVLVTVTGADKAAWSMSSNRLGKLSPGEKQDDKYFSMLETPAHSIETSGYFQEQEQAVHTAAFSGQLRNETAYRINSSNEFTKIKNILHLNLTGKLSPAVSYTLGGRFYYDAVFDLTDTFTENVEDDQEKEADLRSAFLDISLGDWDFRIGKQQIVWGEAVGLFFADVVNPKDLREFILPEFDEIRIPVWAADIEYYIGDNHLEFVWIPVLDFNESGVPGSEFAFQVPSFPPNVIIRTESTKEPSDNFKNSILGIRLSRFIKGWDLSGFYLYSYDYDPVLFREIEFDSTTLITLKPEHKRLHVFGATFSKEVQDVILKGEFIYNQGKYFSVDDPADEDGVVKKDFLDYLLGIDYTFFQKIDFNFQFMQRIVFHHTGTMLEDKTKTSFSIWLKTGFFDNRLEPELFLVSSLKKKDLMFRPKLNYTFWNNWKIAIGMDIFEGESDGDFGRFDGKDRAYVELSYDF